MVEFGKELQARRRQEWAPYYIDYSMLKKQLKHLRATYKSASREDDVSDDGTVTQASKPSLMKRASSMMLSFNMRDSMVEPQLREEVDRLEAAFGKSLDLEVEKVVLFFLETQGELAKRLRHLRRRTNNMPLTPREEYRKSLPLANRSAFPPPSNTSSPSWRTDMQRLMADDTAELEGLIDDIGDDIVALMRFLQLNVTGLRKILKKHDKQIRDRLLASHYLSSRARVKYSCLQQLYHNEGVMAMISSLRRAYEDIEHFKEATRFSPDDKAETGLVSRTYSGTNMPAMASLHDQRRKSLREKAVVFERIHFAQQQLDQAQRRTVQDYLTLGSDLLLEGGMREEEVEEEEAQRELDGFTAMLNLATTFLYMTNYYIVGPTSTDYAAALGGSPAVSGVIIGMTPIAACLSCVLYSWWSNFDFRSPLLLCCALLVVGNVLYGLALSFGAFWMVLLGRVLIGFGGARGVNRRFIADTIPLHDRTFFSAAFVAVGALGMAFGPGCAALINLLDFKLGFVIVNGMTGPGWFMTICWSLLGLLILLRWKEPTFRYNSNKGSKAKIHHARSSESHAASYHGRPGRSLSPPGHAVLPANGIEHIPVNPPPDPAVINMAIDAAKGNGSGGGGSSGLTGVSSGSAMEKVPLLSMGGSSSKRYAQSSNCGSEDLDRESSYDDVKSQEEVCGLPLPVVVCLGGYFVNKLVTEAVVSSAPVLTRYYFDWSVTDVGILMAVLGALTLPINIAVGRLSLVFEDRWLMQLLTVVSAGGCVILINTSSVFGAYYGWQYVIGVSVVFVALQAHEGVIMAVTSKLIPADLASGTFNSGFLATEAGTFARFVGDSTITIMGVWSMVDLSNDLFISSLFSVLLMWAATQWVYPLLDT